MSQFAIAGLQLALKNGDNLSVILQEIKSIKLRFPWLNMVVLSELATYGANPRHALPPGNEAETAYSVIAAELGLWLIPGSLYERDGDKIYNTTPVINPEGEVVARYRKMFPSIPTKKALQRAISLSYSMCRMWGALAFQSVMTSGFRKSREH